MLKLSKTLFSGIVLSTLSTLSTSAFANYYSGKSWSEVEAKVSSIEGVQ